MNVQNAWPELVGDLARFGALTDRIEGLVESQVAHYRSKENGWMVLPWTDGLYLFSEDNEGQRRGRELVLAFLGPGFVSIETVADGRLRGGLPQAWRDTGLIHASQLRKIELGPEAIPEMLSRIEDLVASTGGHFRYRLEVAPTPIDLLRDFRLAILIRDDDAARALFDTIRLSGHVSAENLRYLRLEYLAAFGRWVEMRELPHINALIASRRPRLVSETLLRMVWWTDIAGSGLLDPYEAFHTCRTMEAFGQLMKSIPVPQAPEGRALCLMAAMDDADKARQELLLNGAADSDERSRLESLLAEGLSEPDREVPKTPEPTPADGPLEAYREGRFVDVVAAFLNEPNAQHAELALAAVLDSADSTAAPHVLSIVRSMDVGGDLALGRRARRDLEELERLIDDLCANWLEWACRVSSTTRWQDAAAVARGESGLWPSIRSLDSRQVTEMCDHLLEAVDGVNADQVRAALDLLCAQAVEVLFDGATSDFGQTILVLLSEQDNFSEMVRLAYLDLLNAWLEVGPSAGEYGLVLDQTYEIWTRIASPVAVSWALGVLEAVADLPCPDAARRTGIAVRMVNDVRQYYSRLALRERADTESFASELGLPVRAFDVPPSERDTWAVLNGKLVGIYSLLPRAAIYLRTRLAQLCSVGEVQENHDMVATAALRGLAERADFLIVDTWHAAHQATGAIDAVRPRERQILPRQRGVTGFLKALEEALDA